jgi:triacylglycerol lipase
MWLLGLLLLCAEFSFYGVWLVWPAAQRGDSGRAMVWMLGLPLAARLLVALASYALSRWKGVTLVPSQRLNLIAWLKFFAVEYWHLCIQNLLLIPFRGLFHTRSERGVGSTQGRVLLMQHGYVNNGAVWFFTARALEARGYRVFTLDQPPFASIDTMGRRLAERVDEVLRITGAAQLTLVAHSMGGLICRAYLRRYSGEKVDQLITMGSPHHGTFHAHLASGPNGAQMRPGNAWLQALNDTLVTVPFTSIYSLHDTIISPQTSSVMVGADNVQLSAVGHVSMPSGAATRVALIAALEKAQRPQR